MNRPEERPLSAVLADILTNLQDIVRSEVSLAKAEVKQELKQAAAGGALTAGGAMLALYAFGFLLLAMVFLLARILDIWLAALVVCLIACGGAAILMALGRQRSKRVKLEPAKTMRSVKENVSWIKNRIK